MRHLQFLRLKFQMTDFASRVHNLGSNLAPSSLMMFACALWSLLLPAIVANAQDTATTTQAVTEDIVVELNKLEPLNNGCRAYVVVNNKSQSQFKAMKLDLVLFRPDGIINRRVAVDLAPVRPKKRSVKLFDLDGTPCDQIGSFLINDVLDCNRNDGTSDDTCLARLSVSSLTKAQFSK